MLPMPAIAPWSRSTAFTGAERFARRRWSSCGPNPSPHPARLAPAQPHRAQLAQVHVAEVAAIVQAEAGAQEALLRAAAAGVDEAAGHAQVDDPGEPALEADEQGFAAPGPL